MRGLRPRALLSGSLELGCLRGVSVAGASLCFVRRRLLWRGQGFVRRRYFARSGARPPALCDAWAQPSRSALWEFGSCDVRAAPSRSALWKFGSSEEDVWSVLPADAAPSPNRRCASCVGGSLWREGVPGRRRAARLARLVLLAALRGRFLPSRRRRSCSCRTRRGSRSSSGRGRPSGSRLCCRRS